MRRRALNCRSLLRPALPAGSRLRILPIHACATAACFDSYTVLREGRISGRLERCRGW